MEDNKIYTPQDELKEAESKANRLFPLVVEEIQETITEELSDHQVFSPDGYNPKEVKYDAAGIRKGSVKKDFLWVQNVVEQVIDEMAYDTNREKQLVAEILENLAVAYMKDHDWMKIY